MNSRRRLEATARRALTGGGYARDASLVVAVSGGPDSMALLHCLLRLRDRLGLFLHVAHLNHNFRGEEAEEDARFVAASAKALGLPYTVDKADPTTYQKQHGVSSFEEAAREVRYDFLATVARDVGAAAIALGHTADDQAETILMHILRGSGLQGLRGMQEVTVWRSPRGGVQGTLFRPLLEAKRRDTLAYCRELGIVFREDSTNVSPDFTRSRLRHQLLPLLETYNPRVRDSLIRMGRSSTEATSYLEAEVDRIWPTVGTKEDNSISLDTAGLKSLHPYIQGLIFRRSYREITGALRRLAESHITAMVRLIHSPSGARLDLPKGLVLRVQGQKIILGASEDSEAPWPVLTGEHPLNVPGVTHLPGSIVTAEVVPAPMDLKVADPMVAFFDADRLGREPVVRTRRKGDRFQPLGMVQEKKLKDFFIDQKVPRQRRDAVPLLASDRGIMWVVGYRPSEVSKVRGDTKRVVRVRWETLERFPKDD